ncbi:conserved exported protein of unknown function [Nitrosotalea devaniterrae]|uniref:Uncharacterized protein n=1 Tax=Nitrosotalea devaniterrae TaxID=1078905 RepID=A0A128A5Q3_9ARCH|nr:conserved exported protein of unknown function [Candidatus Nitrosotalea devanaterra]
MEEIALVFSSLAGACTAVALDKVPKIKRNKQTPTINSAIANQLHSLRMEKEVLSKTITRLHQQESDVTRIQKDKLLLRYQHQLGTVITKIEKLEVASKYPDLGPVGDSLISLMDNRLSQLDQRLHEISSKITVNTITQSKQSERPVETILENPQVKKIEPKIESQREKIQEEKIVKPEQTEWLPQIEIPTYEKHRTVELSTLTEITNKIPQFPAEFIRPTHIEPQIQPKIIEPPIVEEPILVPQDFTQNITKEIVPELPKPELVQEPERKIQLPTAIKIPEEEKLEDDDKDLDKIKSEIMKALSKLEQVEVE